MDTAKVKRIIGRCDDPKQLEDIAKAARDRIGLLSRRKFQQLVAQAWERVKGLTPGTTLYCCADGTFLGGPLQRGDSMKFWSVQPRAKRLWVTLANGTTIWMEPGAVHRYNLQTHPPASPIGPNERRMAEAAGEVVNKVFGGAQ